MNKIKYLFSVLFVALTFAACTDELEPMTTKYASFSSSSETIGLLQGEEKVIDVKVYTVNTSGSDRTYGVVIDEKGSVIDTKRYSYQLPSEVVIPSGSNEGVIKVTVKNIDLDFGEKLPLTIFLKGDDENFTQGKFSLNLYSVCKSYDVNVLKGKTLTGQDDWTTPNVEKITVKENNGKVFLSGIAHGFLTNNGVYNFPVSEVADVPIDLDVKTGDFTFARSKTCLWAGQYEIFVEGKGKYISCAKTITLSYNVYINFKGDIVHIGGFIPKGEAEEYILNAVVKE